MSNEEFGEEDFIGSGFKKIDPAVILKRPPQIKWGDKYKKWDDGKKIRYLEKFARSMNHAADLLQNERNELLELVDKKDELLAQMNSMLGENNNLLQSEVTRMNAQRQHYAKEMAKLNTRIKELESGYID
jgi:seryl-tRNA synthetase